ncbi:3469_t:CDS:2, partial [Dentiscutata heterogama]
SKCNGEYLLVELVGEEQVNEKPNKRGRSKKTLEMKPNEPSINQKYNDKSTVMYIPLTELTEDPMC